MLVKFPHKIAVLQRFGLLRSGKQVVLDEEIREIDSAIDALKARRRVLLSEYRREISLATQRAGELTLACALCALHGCPLAAFNKLFTIISTVPL
jgi:hypothetical protein